MSELALFFYVCMPLCFIARYLRKIYILLEKKGGEGGMACIDCKFAVESPQIKRFYCMNNERNKNTDREERYKRTQGIDCPYCTPKERGGEK